MCCTVLLYSSVILQFCTVVLHFSVQGRCEGPSVGGVRLNLPEFTWLISSSVVTNHYLFQCLKAMFFGNLQEVRAAG